MTDMADKDFDFKRVGKRMPYVAPDGLWREMERNVLAEAGMVAVQKPKVTTLHRKHRFGRIGGLAAAVAAAAVLFWGTNAFWRQSQQVNLGDVDSAFGQLSNEDQNFLLEAYGDDVFLNNESDVIKM